MSPDQQGQQFGGGAPLSEPQPPVSQPEPWRPQGNDPLMAGGMPGPLPTAPIIRPVNQGKGKLMAVLSVSALLLIGGVAAAYQFLYVPNTPAAIFRTGLQRSGATMEKLIADVTAEPNLKAVEQSVINGSVAVEADGNKYGGKLEMSSDPDTSDVNVAVDMIDQDGKKSDIGLQLLTQVAEGKKFPDAYFKLQGLKVLGLESLVPGVSQYDNQWVGLSADYFEQLFPVETEAVPSEPEGELSAEDVAEISKAVLNNVRQYVMTDDPAFAVLQQKRFVGTEQLASDITANRYVVSINRTNAKKFCESMINDVTATAAFKKFPGTNPDTLEADKRSAVDSCSEEIDGIKDGDQLELWVDTSYKLISKIRVTSTEQGKSYIEIGQSYKGGDDMPLFLAIHDDSTKSDARVDMLSNLRQSTSKVTVSYTARGDEPLKVKLDVDVKPADKPVEIQKPAKFTPIEDVFKELGLDGATGVVPVMASPSVSEG